MARGKVTKTLRFSFFILGTKICMTSGWASMWVQSECSQLQGKSSHFKGEPLHSTYSPRVNLHILSLYSSRVSLHDPRMNLNGSEMSLRAFTMSHFDFRLISITPGLALIVLNYMKSVSWCHLRGAQGKPLGVGKWNGEGMGRGRSVYKQPGTRVDEDRTTQRGGIPSK
jgi:hypothetical protein